MRAFRLPVFIAWLAVCFYEGERTHPSRGVFAAWIGVLILYSCAVYLIRCPRCGARLGASAGRANAYGKYNRLPTVHNCPTCGVPFDALMPESQAKTFGK